MKSVFTSGTLCILLALFLTVMVHAEEDQDRGTGSATTDAELNEWSESLDEPSIEHRVLDVLAGSWQGTVRTWSEPQGSAERSTFLLERQWILGNRYLHEKYEIASGNDPFLGFGLIGYNVAEGVYEIIWLDNKSTTHYFESGYFDLTTKILTTRGTERDPATGFLHFRRSEMSLAEPDRHTLTGYSTDESGKLFKNIEVVFIRKSQQ